jgi:hypothetical protein
MGKRMAIRSLVKENIIIMHDIYSGVIIIMHDV